MEQWYNEFLKWDYDVDKVEFMCIQSAHKLNKEYDLMIVDEIHTALSEVYSNVFLNIKSRQLLGLTATVPEDAIVREVLNNHCPVVYTKTLKEIDKTGGIIAKTTTYNLPVKLNRKEKAKYNTFNEQFHRATMQIAMLKKDIIELKDINVFDIAKEYSKKKDGNEQLQKQAKAYWSAMTMRKWVCYNAESKIPIVKEILKKFPERKWILFNKSIKFAELLNKEIPHSRVYHSKMKEEERKKVLEDFRNNEFKYLISVDALNAGLNVPDVDSAICISGVSTELVAVQQSGRVGRFVEGKNSIFINLYSEDTIEKTWVTNKTKSLPTVR